MFLWVSLLVLTHSCCGALRLSQCNLKEVPPCTLAYAPHAGFGNQLKGLLRAAWIAEAAGCKVVIPPLLEHHELEFGPKKRCLSGQTERMLVANASRLCMEEGRQTFDSIFQFHPGAVFAQSGFRLKDQSFLAVKCTLFKEMHQDTCNYSNHLRHMIASHNGTQNFAIGSAFSADVPGLDFRDMFIDLNETLKQTAWEMQNAIAQKTGRPVGAYSCMHIRTKDRGKTAHRGLSSWVKKMVDPEDDLPMFLMSLVPWKGLQGALGERCKKVGCVTADELLHERPQQNMRLFVEMALCGLGQNQYLPNAGLVVLREEVRLAPRVGVYSTLSWTIMRIAEQLPKLRELRAKRRREWQQQVEA